MKNLTVKYLGLTLKSPIIVSSSPFTATLEGVKAAAKAGAGAVVLKSIYEEQINSEVAITESYYDYPEAADYVKHYVTDNSLNDYIELIKNVKKECDIAVIASINCTKNGSWVEFAKAVEKAGADAIEVNIFLMPTSKEESGAEIEKRYLAIVSAIKEAVSIPISIKLSQNFTNIANITKEIYFRNVKGVTLFNRFFSPDVDIDKFTVVSSNVWSDHSEIHNVIRACGIISAELPMVDIATSTGVRDGNDAIKMLLCGAKAVQVCSTIHENGIEVVATMNSQISDWMTKHKLNSIDDFIGKTNHKNIPNNNAYERTQFMKYYSSVKA